MGNQTFIFCHSTGGLYTPLSVSVVPLPKRATHNFRNILWRSLRHPKNVSQKAPSKCFRIGERIPDHLIHSRGASVIVPAEFPLPSFYNKRECIHFILTPLPTPRKRSIISCRVSRNVHNIHRPVIHNRADV